jgi:hypothetical protein
MLHSVDLKKFVDVSDVLNASMTISLMMAAVSNAQYML